MSKPLSFDTQKNPEEILVDFLSNSFFSFFLVVIFILITINILILVSVPVTVSVPILFFFFCSFAILYFRELITN